MNNLAKLLIIKRRKKAEEIINLLTSIKQNEKMIKMRKHCPYAVYIKSENMNKNIILTEKCLSFKYNDKEEVFISKEGKFKHHSYSLSSKTLDDHKKYIISRLEMYINRCNFYIKNNQDIREEIVHDITQEFKHKCNCNIKTDKVLMLNILPVGAFIKRETSLKIATSYVIYESCGKLNIMFENMFDYKSYFKELPGKDEALYNDIKSFNSTKNVSVNDFINITNNMGRISNHCWDEYPDGTIVEYSYEAIDKSLNVTINK